MTREFILQKELIQKISCIYIKTTHANQITVIVFQVGKLALIIGDSGIFTAILGVIIVGIDKNIGPSDIAIHHYAVKSLIRRYYSGCRTTAATSSAA